MNAPQSPYALASRTASARRSEALAPTTRGLNYFDIDGSLRALAPLYMEDKLLAHLTPHLSALGELAGERLYELVDDSSEVIELSEPFAIKLPIAEIRP